MYPLHDPGLFVRTKGQAPIEATVYELEKLRCKRCGEVFTAEAPEGVGEEKYDATAASMIALLRYEACHFQTGPVAVVESSKDLARLLGPFPFCTLHKWLLSCENVLDITDTEALTCHRILVWTSLAVFRVCLRVRCGTSHRQSIDATINGFEKGLAAIYE